MITVQQFYTLVALAVSLGATAILLMVLRLTLGQRQHLAERFLDDAPPTAAAAIAFAALVRLGSHGAAGSDAFEAVAADRAGRDQDVGALFLQGYRRIVAIVERRSA